MIGLTQKIPHAGAARHHVRLIAAVADDVMHAVLRTEMLAAIVPGGVEELDRIERAPATPRRAGGMRGLPLERVFDAHQSRSRGRAERGREITVDVAEQHRIDVLE